MFNKAGDPQLSTVQTRSKRVLFGRVWSEACTTFYVLGIPFMLKEKTTERDVLRLIGIPVVMTYYDRFERKTRFLGFPVSTRPNYRYLEQQIADSLNCLHALPKAPAGLRTKQSLPPTLSEARERLYKLPSYQLMCDTRDGRLLLKDELTIVTAQMEKLLAEEDKIDG